MYVGYLRLHRTGPVHQCSLLDTMVVSGYAGADKLGPRFFGLLVVDNCVSCCLFGFWSLVVWKLCFVFGEWV